MHNSTLIWYFILICNFALVNGADVPETVHRESIIAQSCNFEKNLDKSGALIKDESLNNYLNEVLHRIIQDSRLSVKVLRSPSINAFAIANGTIFVCTGLLARIKNEAQLAALLSHEMVHIINDHSYQNLLNTKKMALSSAKKQIGLEFFFGSLATNIVNLTLKSAVSGYSRDLEREADSLGLIKMKEASYAPIEFRNLFLILKDHIEKENIEQPYFFSTHPALTERIDNYYQLAGKDTVQSARGIVNSATYTKMIIRVLHTDGIMKIASGDLDIAKVNFSRILKADSSNAQALLQLGNIARLRSAPNINKNVFNWYYRAKDNDSTGEVLRELGFYYFKSGKIDSAACFLKSYLQNYPLSPYQPLVEDYLKKCVR